MPPGAARARRSPPLFDTLAQTYGDQVKFVKVDIDDNKKLA